MKKQYKVAICGYYGFGNLGDELLLDAVVKMLEENDINKEKIIIFSGNPEQTEARLGICSVNRWNISDVFSSLRESETFLLGGGGLFQDVTSIKTPVYYWGLVKLATIAGAKPWAVGQSVGPLSTALGRVLCRNAFKSCHAVSVRDVKSSFLLKSWKIENEVTPDMVFLFSERETCQTHGGDRLLVNVRPGFDNIADKVIVSAKKKSLEENIKTVGVAFSDEDMEKFEEYEQKGIFQADFKVKINSFEDFVKVAENASYVIGMRYHFLLLSLIEKLDINAAPYDPKVIALCSEYNIPTITKSCDKVKIKYPSGMSSKVRNSFGKMMEKMSEVL